MSFQDVLPPLVPAAPVVIEDLATAVNNTTEYAVLGVSSEKEAHGEPNTTSPPNNDEVVKGSSAESVASVFGQWTNCRRCHKLTVAGGAFCAYCGIPSPNGVRRRRRRSSASQTSPSGPLKASGLRLVITTGKDGSNLFMKQREPGVVVSSSLPTAMLPEDPTPLCLPPTFASLKAHDGETNGDLGRACGRGHREEEEVSLRDEQDGDNDDDISDDECLSELSDESDCSSDSSDSSCESDCFDDEDDDDFDDEDIIIELEDTTHNTGEEGPRLFTSVGHGDSWGDRVGVASFLGDAVVSAASLGQVM